MNYRDTLNDFITKGNMACSSFLLMFKGAIIFGYLMTISMTYDTYYHKSIGGRVYNVDSTRILLNYEKNKIKCS